MGNGSTVLLDLGQLTLQKVVSNRYPLGKLVTNNIEKRNRVFNEVYSEQYKAEKPVSITE